MDAIDEMELEDWAMRTSIDRQKKKLMRLNRSDLQTLAKHYKINSDITRWCFEPHDYKHGGKEEICEEIAECMVDWP